MLDPYRRILSRPGTFAFSASGLVARLPISMLGLGLVLMVQDATGSYATAGAVSATAVIAEAVMALLHGRLVDTYGQSRVLPIAIVIFGAALAFTIYAVQQDLPAATWYVGAALAGAALPQVGACVRARWAHVLDEAGQVQTAFALESVLDEVVFVVGPILATILGTSVHPVAGLTVALVSGVAGTLAFAMQRGTEPVPRKSSGAVGAKPPLPWRTVVPLTVVCVGLGVLFGGAEVVAVAFSEEQGAKAYSGVLLALWAFGSLVSGVLTGLISWRQPLRTRLRIGATGMMATMIPLFLVDDMWLMGLVLLIGGCAVSPTLIASLALVEEVAPPSRLTEGMAVLHTGLVGGVALGAASVGPVIDRFGAGPAWLVCAVAGAVAASSALLLPRTAPRDVSGPGAGQGVPAAAAPIG